MRQFKRRRRQLRDKKLRAQQVQVKRDYKSRAAKSAYTLLLWAHEKPGSRVAIAAREAQPEAYLELLREMGAHFNLPAPSLDQESSEFRWENGSVAKFVTPEDAKSGLADEGVQYKQVSLETVISEGEKCAS